MFSSGLVFDDAAVVNYTGCAPLGPDGQHLFLLPSADVLIDQCLLNPN